MKKENLRKAFDNAKHRLVSKELGVIVQFLKEQTKDGRDWIYVKNIIKVFEEIEREDFK